MKILMLVNWKILYGNTVPQDKQTPDYYIEGMPYWFYRYFIKKPEVDVIDISSFKLLEDFEKNKLHFYIWQTLKIIPKLGNYDLIISHGMQSGVVLSLWRRIFNIKAKHIVFDIGSFNSAAEKGFALRLMQFASRSIDGIIYHTSSQIQYYRKYYPWILPKSSFIRFGTDTDFFNLDNMEDSADKGTYILCVGYAKRDWNTIAKSYEKLKTNINLRLIGHVESNFNKPGIEQIPFMPIKDLVKQMYNARFCVLPLESFNYSFGQMTLLQQMALGKCVITSKVPSMLDYIEDGRTGIFYEAGNVDELADQIAWAIKESDEIEEVGKNARNWVEQYGNEESMAKEIEKFYMRIY